jgi:hypothetical protein
VDLPWRYYGSKSMNIIIRDDFKDNEEYFLAVSVKVKVRIIDCLLCLVISEII